jgi:hypothetical protein
MIGTAQGYPTMLGKFPSMNGADNVTLFRVEEMHLIAAETSLRAGNTADALTYLNNIPCDKRIRCKLLCFCNIGKHSS